MASRSSACAQAAASAPAPGLRLAYARPELPAERAPASAAAAGATAGEANGAAEAVVLDRAALAGIRALERPGSGDLLRRVIDRYCEDAPRLVASMRTAAANEDAHALQVAAHTLKSASANLGAVALAGMCKNLEMTGRSGVTSGAAEALPELEHELQRVESALQAEVAQQAAG
jgi:HPt (histidine-containing phosphotransfer) domain-containing protein